MMKSTPQIADGLAALSIKQLQRRIFELAVMPDRMLLSLHPKSVPGIRTKGCVILLNPGKIAQLCHPGWKANILRLATEC
jgi:hypothetical protein